MMEWRDYDVDYGEQLTVLKFQASFGYFDIIVSKLEYDMYDLDDCLMLFKIDGNSSASATFKDVYRIFLKPIEIPLGSKFVGVKLYEGSIN